MSATPTKPYVPSFCEMLERLGITLTDAQKAIALVAFDHVPFASLGALRAIAEEIFGAYLKSIDPVALSVFILVAGARSGKSYLGALRLLYLGLTVSLDSLAVGEHAFGAIVAPDLRLARQALRYVAGECERGLVLAMFGARVESSTADSLTIRRADGRVIVIETLPATRGGSALRARWFFGALIDELAFLRGEDFVVNADEIYNAISARLLPEAQLLGFSTPWTRSGLLWDLYSANFRKPSAALVGHASTLIMRRGDRAAEMAVERERRRNARNFAREFLAQFSDSASVVFDGEDLDACIDRGVENRPPDPNGIYYQAIDIGLRRDFSVAIAFHVELQEREGAPPVRVLVIDAVRILKPGLFTRVTLDEVEKAFVALAKRYKVRRVFGDLHYADALSPRFKDRGLKFEEVSMSPKAQEERVAALAARIASRTVRLVDDKDLIQQLREIREFKRSGGLSQYGAPETKNAHDDAVDCLLIAAEQAALMPVSGTGNLRAELEHRFEPGLGHDFVPHWYRRGVDPITRGEMWLPTLAPQDTPLREEQERELAAMGAYVADEGQRAINTPETIPNAATTIAPSAPIPPTLIVKKKT